MSEKKVRAIGEPRSLNETRDDLAEQVVALKGAAPDLALDCLREIEELCRALALKWHSFNDAMVDAKEKNEAAQVELSALRARVEELTRERDEAKRVLRENIAKDSRIEFDLKRDLESARALIEEMKSRYGMPCDLQGDYYALLGGKDDKVPGASRTPGNGRELDSDLPAGPTRSRGDGLPSPTGTNPAPEGFEEWHRRECPYIVVFGYTKPCDTVARHDLSTAAGCREDTRKRFAGHTCREVYAQERPEGGVGERPCAIVDGKPLWCCPTNHDLHYPTCHRDNHAILKARPSEPVEALEESARIIEAMRPTYCRADDATCVEATCIEARELLAKIRARKGER